LSEGGGLRLVRRDEKTVEVELVGEDHTMANLIAKYAIRRPDVVYSSYIMSHPLAGNPVIVLTTDGSKDPLEVLEEVLREIISDVKSFENELQKAFQRGETCRSEGGV